MDRAGDPGWLRVYLNIPTVTRIFITATILVTLASHFELVSPYDLYLNPALILERHQYWRILTSFLFAGPITFGTVFNLLFMYRYSRILEEHYVQRTSEYCVMVIFLTTVVFILSARFTDMIFLNNSFTHAILYIWCRRNPMTRVAILGLFTFHAHFVPFVLLGLTILTGGPLSSDVVSIAAGHTYYFLEDVFPRQRGGFRILKIPQFLRTLFEAEPMYSEPGPNENIEEQDPNNNLIDGRLAPDVGPLLEENGL
ncbi:Derlin-2 [Orchesella cincta]|uniref:Derlin n=1 Tax=Orchesella cincta TaxID=48709 RepID=A0A1D2NCW5_ORCCI|nr:Derlin-2 [Orchesella cincta]